MSFEEDLNDPIGKAMQRMYEKNKHTHPQKKEKKKKERRGKTVGQKATNFAVNKELGEEPNIPC